jgi:hypothetical protein
VTVELSEFTQAYSGDRIILIGIRLSLTAGPQERTPALAAELSIDGDILDYDDFIRGLSQTLGM